MKPVRVVSRHGRACLIVVAGAVGCATALQVRLRRVSPLFHRAIGVGHTSSDGSTTVTRLQRYGTWQVTYDENIGYSPIVHGSDMIQNLLIDDGVPDRGHRRNIFDPLVTVVGIACGPHPRFGSECVIVQAGGFTSK